MVRAVFIVALIIGIFLSVPAVLGQIENIGSEHVRLRMPPEREALGRDLAAELERCYLFMNRATGQNLPRRVLILADWTQSEDGCNHRSATVTIGMKQPAAAADVKGYLLHRAAREMARLGLLGLSGGARREDTEFLFEGMIEILAHEYARTSRGLDAAWVIAQYLDQMKLLDFSTQRSWTRFSAGKRCLKTAAPGVTLLNTLRALQGRDAPLKLFEALKKKSLTESLATAFKAPAGDVESIWLKKVREYQPVDEISVAPESAPQLLQTNLAPGTAAPGSVLEFRLIIKDRGDDLPADGVFLRDERTGRVLQASEPEEKGPGDLVVKLPIEDDCAPGEYKYSVSAIDESGNLRRWTGIYRVGSKQ